MDSKGTGETIMQIYVDADACPVVGIVETIAEKSYKRTEETYRRR